MAYIKAWNPTTEDAVKDMAAAGNIQRKYLQYQALGTEDHELVVLLDNGKSSMAIKLDRFNRNDMRSFLNASTMVPVNRRFARAAS